jgi:hypothetical protein
MLGAQRMRILRTRIVGKKPVPVQPTLRLADGYLVAECADGGILRIIDCDLDGVPLDTATFAEHFGREPVPLGENT